MKPVGMHCAVAPWFEAIFRAHAENTLFQQLVAMYGGTLMVDEAARIAWMDDKYMAAFGLDETAIGQKIESIVPESRMREVIETGKPIFLDIIQVRGSKPVVCTRLPLKDAHGTLHGAVAFMIYERHQYLQPLINKVTALQAELAAAQQRLAGDRQTKYSFLQLIGNSPPIREVKRVGRRAAQIDTTVLLLGETGTGKELLAHAIHHASARAKKPFVSVNVAAVPETLMEAEFFGAAPGAYTGADRRGRDGKLVLANGGTLFLDEIGDMPLALQPKLLRALQEREVEPLGGNKVFKIDIRIIAATSRDLGKMVRDGLFRADLYYRLNVLPITLPPLRERIEDLPYICENLLERIAGQASLPPLELEPSALEAMMRHSWPGNVRELANVLERLAATSETSIIGADELSGILLDGSATAIAGSGSLQETERQAIVEALAQAKGVKSVAARRLGISRTTLYEKINAYGLAATGGDRPK